MRHLSGARKNKRLLMNSNALLPQKKFTAQPHLIGKFHLEVDASGYALGGVLSQLQDDKWRSVTFISRTMTDAELNYDIYDKELLAIM